MSDLESVANARRERVAKQKAQAEYRQNLREYMKQVDAAWQRLTGARVWTREGGGAIDRERWSTDGLAAVCALAKLLAQSNLADQAAMVRDRIFAYLKEDPLRFEYAGVIVADCEELGRVGCCADLLCRALAGQSAEALQEIEGVEICQHPDQWDSLRLEINCCDPGLPIAPREVSEENAGKVSGEAEVPPADAARMLVIEKSERNTPALDVTSIEWVAARKKNQEILGYPPSTLAQYRLPSKGGRKLTEYFGIDKDGRRWRRCGTSTPKSTVYYYQPDLEKHQPKVSN